MRALARALFRRARGSFDALGPDGLAAIDAFIARPGPAAYLRAVRVIAAEERTAARQRLERGGAQRAFDDGLAALLASGLDEDTVRFLTDRPASPGLGARLEALAALVVVHRELAGRAEAAVQVLRAKMAAHAQPKARRSHPL